MGKTDRKNFLLAINPIAPVSYTHLPLFGGLANPKENAVWIGHN